MTSSDFEARLERLEAREAIRELVARYAYVIDDRDLEGIGECFCRDGGFSSKDGVMDARGRDAVMEQFRSRFAVLGPGIHWAHDHCIWFDDDRLDHARGNVATHAELLRNGEPMVVALRYDDEYRLEDGKWRFADRVLSFFYYCRLDEYPEILKSANRMRAYESPAPADYPEPLATWQKYQRPG